MSSNITPLSTGIIPRIMGGENVDTPVLQVLHTRIIKNNLRVSISDSQYLSNYVMLSPSLYPNFGDGKLQDLSIVRLDEYIVHTFNKEKIGTILVIMRMTVLNAGGEVKRQIGRPIPYTKTAMSVTPPVHINTENIRLIANLVPWQKRWTIKARITAKTPIRPFKNGKGKRFSIDLLDESGEIRAIAFNNLVDKFYDLIETYEVYYISKGDVILANKEFSNLNDYEISFNNETVIQICDDNDKSGVPEVKYNFIPISEVANLESEAKVDCIGVCKEIGELQNVTSQKTDREYKKRELMLVDTSERAVTLTLWGEDAVNFDGPLHQVILVKGAKVNEFKGGKSLSLLNGSVMKINPNISECQKLREWYENGGGENITISISTRTGDSDTEWCTFREMRNLQIGDNDEYFKTKAIIHIVNSANAYYKGCPQPQCNNKVVDCNNGKYRCEKCNDEYHNFKYKLRLRMNVGDWTSSKWVTCFSDLAEQLLGRSAQEIGEALENNPSEAEEILGGIIFRSFMFKLRSKIEVYEDTPCNKLIAQSVSPVSYKEYNKYLINNLKELTGIN